MQYILTEEEYNDLVKKSELSLSDFIEKFCMNREIGRVLSTSYSPANAEAENLISGLTKVFGLLSSSPKEETFAIKYEPNNLVYPIKIVHITT